MTEQEYTLEMIDQTIARLGIVRQRLASEVRDLAAKGAGPADYPAAVGQTEEDHRPYLGTGDRARD